MNTVFNLDMYEYCISAMFRNDGEVGSLHASDIHFYMYTVSSFFILHFN